MQAARNILGRPDRSGDPVREPALPATTEKEWTPKFSNLAGAPDTGGCGECGNGRIDSAENWSSGAKRGAGTEAVLTVRAAAAYGSSNGGRFSFLRRNKARS